MNFLVVLLVLVSAFLHAVRNLFTKQGGDKRVFIWWYEVFALVFFLPFFIYFLLTERLNPLGVYIGLGVGLVHFFYWVFMAKSYEAGEFSHVYPITRSSPALVLAASVLLLNEQVSFLGVAGILLTVFGIYMLHMKEFSLKEFIAPVYWIKEDKATRLAIVTLILVSTYSLVDKVGVQYIHPFIYSYLLNLSALAIFTSYILKVRSREQIKSEWISNKKTILANGFITFFGYLLILVAFTIEKVSYIVGLREISVVFGVIMGRRLLNEGRMNVRLTAATIIFIGSVSIAVAN